MPKKRRGRKKGSEQQIEPERGVDEACEIIWRPDASTSEVVLEDMLNPVKSKSIANKQGNVDLIVDALRLINVNRGPQAAQSKVAELLQQHPYHASLVQWSDVDSNIFDLDLEDHEDELGRYTRTRKVKSYPEIVHHYYREKGYQKRFMHLEDPAQDKFAAAGPQGIEGEHGDLTIDGEQEDDDGSSSVVEDIPPSSGRKVKHHCAMCGTDKADAWYHCPEGLGHQDEGQKDHVVCSSCSIQWRHCRPFLGHL